jgi:hypothetical protein
MSDCANLSKCAFFKQYENLENKKLALRGFVRHFAKVTNKMNEDGKRSARHWEDQTKFL